MLQRAGLPRASEAAGEVKQGGGGVGGSARPQLGGEARYPAFWGRTPQRLCRALCVWWAAWALRPVTQAEAPLLGPLGHLNEQWCAGAV